MLYGEDESPEHTALLQVSGGLDVYIRKKPTCDPAMHLGNFE